MAPAAPDVMTMRPPCPSVREKPRLVKTAHGLDTQTLLAKEALHACPHRRFQGGRAPRWLSDLPLRIRISPGSTRIPPPQTGGLPRLPCPVTSSVGEELVQILHSLPHRVPRPPLRGQRRADEPEDRLDDADDTQDDVPLS